MLDLINELQELKSDGNRAVLCIVTESKGSSPGKAGAKMLVFAHKPPVGTVGGGAIELSVIQQAALMLQKSSLTCTKVYALGDDLQMHCGGEMTVYFEIIGGLPRLLIFGGGHIAQALAPMALAAGFLPLVVDPREDILRFHENKGYQTICLNYEDVEAGPEPSDRDFIVIVTHRHLHDEFLALHFARKPHTYLGMIGSQRKVDLFKQRALAGNLLTLDELNRIDMPVGLRILAKTPAEIAVSILAGMIAIKNKEGKE